MRLSVTRSDIFGMVVHSQPCKSLRSKTFPHNFNLLLYFNFAFGLIDVQSPSNLRPCGRVSSSARKTVSLHLSVSGLAAQQHVSLVSLLEVIKIK